VNGGGNRARSGAQTRVLLAAPLNSLLLPALGAGPRQLSELLRATGAPAQTTLRTQLRRLTDIGVVAKHRCNSFPGALEYRLTPAGDELVFVIETLKDWLAQAPEAPVTLGSNEAKTTIKALAEGWSTTMLRALAAGPLSLTELDRVIASLSYPSLERRLAAMRLAGHVEAASSNGRGTPYALTEWARRGISPIAAAARWERRHLSRGAPIGRIDIEAAFLLSLPLLSLPGNVSGSCRMAVEAPNGGAGRLAGVVVMVENGRVASCTSRLQGAPNAWALGSVTAWLEAFIEGDTDRIEPGGDSQLARALLDSLHRELFGERSYSA
jgi:DNA-binding HxlR family transcriptional regulator